MALWTGKIALRYGNMTLRMTDNLLTIESGLVSRFTCRLAREKTTVLTIKRNPLEKIAGCQTISLQQAENATDNKNEGGIRIYGSNLGDELLTWWLGNRGSVNDTTPAFGRIGHRIDDAQIHPASAIGGGGAAIIMISTKLALAAVMAGAVYAAIAAVRAAMEGHLQLTATLSPISSNCTAAFWPTRSLPTMPPIITTLLPLIVELRSKAGENRKDEIETCFDALYGILMLKLQKKKKSLCRYRRRSGTDIPIPRSPLPLL